jgi:hypothetical protein
MSGFAQVSAPDKPFLICKGRVTHIGEAKSFPPYTEEGIDWISQSFRIEGYGASENIFVNFKYRPEWFDRSFSADQIGGSPAQIKEQLKEYRFGVLKVEGGKRLPTTLFAAVGFDEAQFDALAEALFSIDIPAFINGEVDGAETLTWNAEHGNAVTDVLNQFCVGNDFGYELKQGVTPAGTDEEGKIKWQNSDKYKVSGYFELTQKNLEQKMKRAEKAEPGTVKFLIDETAF